MCDHGDKNGAVGFIRAPADALPDCVADMGQKWMYYGSDSASSDIVIQCTQEGKMAVINYMPSALPYYIMTLLHYDIITL